MCQSLSLLADELLAYKQRICSKQLHAVYLLTAIGFSPGGSGYFTCKQNMKSVTAKFSREGYMRSMYWQLGMLGTV